MAKDLNVNKEGKRSQETKTDWKEAWITPPNVIAVILLIGYIILLFYMSGLTGLKDDLIWTRNVYLLTGYEALAFAAGGYIFGKEVHRKEAEKAEERADNAQEQANDAQEKENKTEIDAYKLAEANRASWRRVQAVPTKALPGEEEVPQEDLKYLAKLADDLFPPKG
jgi:hypothetical protein